MWRQSRARGLVIVSRVATSRHPGSRPPTLFMSRTSPGTAQEPLARTDTPDPDATTSRKRVRWNSDSVVVEGDKQGDSEESNYDCKVGGSCPFMSTFVCHLTRPPPRLSRRFVLQPHIRRKAVFAHICAFRPQSHPQLTLKGTNWLRILRPGEFSDLRARRYAGDAAV